jgi:uncharacterized heparinase superfamily protein
VLTAFVGLEGHVHNTVVLTGKHTAIYEKFLRKLDLTVKYVAKTAYFVPIGLKWLKLAVGSPSIER